MAKWIMQMTVISRDYFCICDRSINFLLTFVSYNDGSDECQTDINLNDGSALHDDEESHQNLSTL